MPRTPPVEWQGGGGEPESRRALRAVDAYAETASDEIDNKRKIKEKNGVPIDFSTHFIFGSLLLCYFVLIYFASFWEAGARPSLRACTLSSLVSFAIPVNSRDKCKH